MNSGVTAGVITIIVVIVIVVVAVIVVVVAIVVAAAVGVMVITVVVVVVVIAVVISKERKQLTSSELQDNKQIDCYYLRLVRQRNGLQQLQTIIHCSCLIINKKQ